MQIAKYNITLRSIDPGDLEMIRNWRNAEHVRSYMEYTDYITTGMQQAWYSGLDLSKNLYFIILHEEKEIGVVNLKDIDAVLKTAEAGIFIGLTAYLDSMVPFLATITLMEFAFETLQLQTLKAKISATNSKGILFNKGIGYKKAERQENERFHYYTVSHADFLTATQGLRYSLDKLR